MNRPTRTTLLIVGLPLAALVAALIYYSSANEYADDHSLLTKFDLASGQVTIDHYGTIITGPLQDVNWKTPTEEQKNSINNAILDARRDFVTHKVSESGHISIWYINKEGKEIALHEKIGNFLTSK